MFGTKGYIARDALTKESLLSLVSQYDVFKYYIPTFKVIGRKFCSDLRKDRSPTCSIIKISGGTLIYKDFGNGASYTCIRYVQSKYNLKYPDALMRIAHDFGLSKYNVKELQERKKVSDETIVKADNAPIQIKITSIPFTRNGLIYWQEYGVNESLLNLFKVKQISHFIINGYQADVQKEIAFAYCFGKYRYKLLRPKAEVKNKWRNNCNSSVIQGFKQLPKSGELLVITKSLKDVMSLRAFNIYAIAPQSENTQLPEKSIPWLKERWDKILIYYDNDVPGLEAAQSHSLLYELPYVHNPIGKEKDFSDYYKSNGHLKAKDLLQTLIYA
tara:strand:- start:81 stop:1067 length:987 start_codon:yes stop_codon:yes gene_type:complete